MAPSFFATQEASSSKGIEALTLEALETPSTSFRRVIRSPHNSAFWGIVCVSLWQKVTHAIKQQMPRAHARLATDDDHDKKRKDVEMLISGDGVLIDSSDDEHAIISVTSHRKATKAPSGARTRQAAGRKEGTRPASVQLVAASYSDAPWKALRPGGG